MGAGLSASGREEIGGTYADSCRLETCITGQVVYCQTSSDSLFLRIRPTAMPHMAILGMTRVRRQITNFGGGNRTWKATPPAGTSTCVTSGLGRPNSFAVLK